MRIRCVLVMLFAATALAPVAGRAAAPEPTILPPILTGPPPALTPTLPAPQNPIPVLPDAKPPVQATPVEPKFECPKTPYVDCMPPINGTQRPLCSKEYKERVKARCPGVEFVY
jgi:hypothetical protein